MRNELYSISHCVLRLGTLYGPDMRETAVIPKFIDMAQNGEDITIFGTGEQFRQFTHVEDACRAFMAVLEEKTEGVYNIVSEEKIFIKRLAEDLKKYFPDLNVVYKAARDADVANLVVFLIKHDVGWKAQKTFEKGLQEMVESKQ